MKEANSFAELCVDQNELKSLSFRIHLGVPFYYLIQSGTHPEKVLFGKTACSIFNQRGIFDYDQQEIPEKGLWDFSKIKKRKTVILKNFLTMIIK